MLLEDESAPKSNGALRGRPPPGINLRFCGMACDAVEAMRTRVLQNKKCYSKSKQLYPEEPVSIYQSLYFKLIGISVLTYSSAQPAHDPA